MLTLVLMRSVSVQLCLQLMTELDDDISEWLEMDDADQETDEE